MGTRVIVTDVQERSMLAVVRCLGTQGFDVTGVAGTRTAPGWWSRNVGMRHLAPDPRRDVHGFIDRLSQLVERDRHDILVPGTDAALLAVSRYRDRLEPHVRLGLPPHDAVERSLNREDLAREATAVGLAPPDEQLCLELDAALAAADAFGYPVLVKPLHTVVEANGTASRWASAIARDRRSLTDAFTQFGQCVVQRRVPGAVVSFGGVIAGGELLGFAVSRYLRTWPPDGGNVCFSETISAPDGLAERVRMLASALGWEGIFELEMIEGRDGSHAAIDFNPRAYGSLGLAIAAGAPLPAMWCAWLMGERQASTGAGPGFRYRWEDADLRRFVWALLQRDYASARTVATPARSVTHAYFSRRDPVPALARWVQIGWMLPARRHEVARLTDHAA